MDILYTLGRGSKWQDNELRYSLRSISKYGKNVGRIFICGDWCPGFVDRDKVTFIRCAQPYKDKFSNILYSIVYACEHSDISEDFLLSSDDHFYMQPTDFDNYPYWLKAIDLPSSDCLTGYKRHLWETRCLLERHGYDTANYAQHCNTHFVKSVLLAHKDIIEESYTLFKGVEATCLMLNILMKERPFKYVVREDCKLRDADDPTARVVENMDCFSIGDAAISTVEPILQKAFPKPSKYEISYSCCVVIPIYKERLSPGEEKSVDQTFAVFKGRPMIFFAPRSLDISYYKERYGADIRIKRFDNKYFMSVDGYTQLLCTPEFYEAFDRWDYMLIDQPDCWVFRDEIDKFCAMGYDYIGAPWPEKKIVPKMNGVGNGGFCLRRIKKFIEICKTHQNSENLPEDWFFCVNCCDDLDIAPVSEASHFSLEISPAHFYYKYGEVLPMGCHKPGHYSYDKFWKAMGVPDMR